MKGKREKRYDLIDRYEDPVGDCLFSSDNLAEIKAKAKEYREDTDGECELFLADLDKREIEAI